MLKTLRPSWGWMLPVLLVIFMIAASRLAADLIWYDEYWSIYNSGVMFGDLGAVELWQRTYGADMGAMGIVYNGLFHLWQRMTGFTPFTLRAFSLLWGVLTLAAVYRVGRHYGDSKTGLLAASILAVSVLFSDYLHEVRAYTLLVFLAVWTVFSYQRVMRSRRFSVFWIVSLVLSLTGLAYTHHTALTVAAVVGLHHLLTFRRSRRWWLVLVAMLSVLLWMLPWFAIILAVIQAGANDIARQTLAMSGAAVLQDYLGVVSNGSLAFLLLLLLFAFRYRQPRDKLLWAWLLLPLVLVLVVNALIPFAIHIRYLLLTIPAAALLLALGMQRLRAIPAGLLLAIWMIVGVYHMGFSGFLNDLYGQIEREPAAGFERSLEALADRAAPDDLALLHITRPGYGFMVEDTVVDYYLTLYDLPLHYDLFDTINDALSIDREAYLRDVRTLLAAAPVVWTLVDPLLPRDWRYDVVDYALRTDYARCELIVDTPEMQQALYSRMPDVQGIRFGDGVLHVTNLERGSQRGDALRVTLGLTMPDLPPDTYSLSLHLYNEQDMLVRQVDFGLPNQRPYACLSQAVPLAGLPSGNYDLRVIAYAWQTGERLLTDSGADMVSIGRVTLR